MMCCLAMGFGCFPWIGLFTFMSNWPVFTLTGHIILALQLSRHPDAAIEHHHKLALYHFFFTITFLLNLVIIPIYWTILHADALRKYGHDACQKT